MGHNQRIKRERKRQRIIALSLILVVLLGGYALSTLYQEREKLHVTFSLPTGAASYRLEVADSPSERAKGLMYRKALPKNGGMIFIEDQDKVQSFWMRNTFVSLDMVFVDSNKEVVGVLDSVPILNDEPRSVGKPSRYVIELPAGSAKRDGIVVGTKVSF